MDHLPAYPLSPPMAHLHQPHLGLNGTRFVGRKMWTGRPSQRIRVWSGLKLGIARSHESLRSRLPTIQPVWDAPAYSI